MSPFNYIYKEELLIRLKLKSRVPIRLHLHTYGIYYFIFRSLGNLLDYIWISKWYTKLYLDSHEVYYVIYYIYKVKLCIILFNKLYHCFRIAIFDSYRKIRCSRLLVMQI